jgi:hypothetical protein
MVTVRELDDEYPAWNQMVADSPQGNVFARSDWLRMLCDTDPSLRVLILGCFDDSGRLVGGQAIPWQTLWGLHLSAEFEFFYCGPMLAPAGRGNLARRTADHHQIVTALAQALSDRLAYIHVDAHPAFQDVRPFLYAGWQATPAYTHIWRMSDTEQIWQDMNREKRREIRRAQETFTFRAEEDAASFDAFLPLYHQTMRKFTWQPSVRWQNIFIRRFAWMRQRDGCRLYTARDAGGKLAAGVVVLLSREDATAYLWRQGSSPDFVAAGGVPALYWHAACDLASDFPNVNFGGSPQASLSHFKDYLGAEAVQHFALSRRNSRRIAALEWGQRFKDLVYNVVMRVAFTPWQRLRYGRRRA